MANITIESDSYKTKIYKNRNKIKDRPPSKINLDLSHKKFSLTPIPKEVLTKFLKTGIIEIADNAKCEHSYVKMDDRTHIITIFTTNEKQGEMIVDAMMYKVAHQLGIFIEKETGEDRKKFYRSITLFESSIEENRASIRWS